jgi:hypothetical protein
MLKVNNSHKLGTIGGFGIERKKRLNREALIINKLKGLPGRIRDYAPCLMRTRGTRKRERLHLSRYKARTLKKK